MAQSTLQKGQQSDFSAGMFRVDAREKIPYNGVWDAENCLVDESAQLAERGGTDYLTAAAFGGGLTWLWDGVIGDAHRTLIANTDDFGLVNPADGTVTNLGGSGMRYPVKPAVMGGKLYLPRGVTFDGRALGTAKLKAELYAAAGGKLWAMVGSRAHASAIGNGEVWPTDEFHELPDGARFIAAEGTRDKLALFTTRGVFLVSGVELDLTDADGNQQQQLDLFSRELVPLNGAGIGSWQGGLIVPAIDGIWLLSVGNDPVTGPPPFQRLSDPITDLYAEYVRVGYRPGLAAVYRGHYFLPILAGSSVVDLLVCRLKTQAWTRFSGHGGRLSSLAVRVGAGAPVLLGAQRDVTARVSTLRYFEKEQREVDADGSSPRYQVVTRDYRTGDQQTASYVKRLRTNFALEDEAGVNPTVQAAYAIERPAFTADVLWGGTTWGGSTWDESEEGFTTMSGTAPEDATGALNHSWRVGKTAQRVRFRFRVTARNAKAVLRSIDVHIRPTGRF